MQCKSMSPEDVVNHNPRPLPFSGCRRSLSSLNDVVARHHRRRPATTASKKRHHRRPAGPPPPPSPPALPPTSPFPTLVELPAGHSSRKVVEIIFHTSWAPGAAPARIEMLFKVRNPAATVARFEEYRQSVKRRAAASSPARARCLADGNEVMRFHCVGPAAGAGKGDATGLCTFSRKGAAIRTFAGSGAAHECAGGYKGRRAMLVCRVIAGRVCGGVESFLNGAAVGGFDSVSGEKESLVVFDSRALLPCFLIIYKV